MNARQLYFWPGMSKDIKRMVSRCEKCTFYLPSQSLEPQIETAASRPFEKVSVDLGHYHGQEYVILADWYTGWPLVRPLTKTYTKAVTDILEGWFLDHGVPISISTDGGPQFRGPFETWCKKQGITPELSSAHHHESNGHAKCSVREMKKLLGKTGIPDGTSQMEKHTAVRRPQPRPVVIGSTSKDRCSGTPRGIR
jgi:hypothetical protein